MSTTPLAPLHETLGARFTDFGGWSMPLQYEGVLAEHAAVRRSAGVFDVSHLGRVDVSGGRATEALVAMLCNDIRKAAPGRAQYTMALNDAGGVDDDIIVWRSGPEAYSVIPNGTNHDEILAALRECGLDPVDRRETTVLLAVQGPEAPDLVESVLGSCPGRFRVESGSRRNADYIAAGTGYTGEPGAEIQVPAAEGASLMEELLAAGATPCGLGARDTLRLEMGYPLWGQDLDATTTPLEAQLGWVVDWDHDFTGRQALASQREMGVAKTLVGFVTEGRLIPRHGHQIRSGEARGTVTSGNFSPTLACGIGLGYLDVAGRAAGRLELEVRGAWHPVTPTDPPFIER